MTNKNAYEALDSTCRDILIANNYDADNKVFGGITIILVCDF